MQPWACIEFAGQQADNSGPDPKWQWNVNVLLYVNEDTADGPAETALGLVDAIEKALRVQPGETKYPGGATTLGNKVIACRPTSIDLTGGNLGAQMAGKIALAVITVM
jgi:hypothetical protein